MGQATGASYNKAFFTNVDTQSVFYVQFNPKDFKLDEKANWKASDEHESDKPLLTYEKGEPTTVSMDLIFDSTDTGDNVYNTYVMPLRDFLTSDVNQTDQEGDKMTRPPYCKFTWGSFTFDCVVEKVSATFMMFKPDGTPLRAKVNVGLKERQRNVPGGSDPQVMLTALGSMVSGSGTNATTYTSIDGDTTTSIAHRFGANPKDVALANNIDDPMDIRPGTRLVIPANSQLAQVLAKQSLQHTAPYWKNDRKLDPFEVRGAEGGDTRFVPSSLDEDGPVTIDRSVHKGSLQPAHASFGGHGQSGKSVFEAGTAMEYDQYEDGEFAFHKPQTYGDYGESEGTFGDSGKMLEYGGYGKSAPSGFYRDDATPIEQGDPSKPLSYGGYGEGDAGGGGGSHGGSHGGDGGGSHSSSGGGHSPHSDPAHGGGGDLAGGGGSAGGGGGHHVSDGGVGTPQSGGSGGDGGGSGGGAHQNHAGGGDGNVSGGGAAGGVGTATQPVGGDSGSSASTGVGGSSGGGVSAPQGHAASVVNPSAQANVPGHVVSADAPVSDPPVTETGSASTGAGTERGATPAAPGTPLAQPAPPSAIGTPGGMRVSEVLERGKEAAKKDE